MSQLTERIKAELDGLVKEASGLFADLTGDKGFNRDVGEKAAKDNSTTAITRSISRQAFNLLYQSWYTRSSLFVKQILPDRHQEFVEQYNLPRRKEMNYHTYTISDFLAGYTVKRGGQEIFDTTSAVGPKFVNQLAILRSARGRIDSILADVKGVLQAQLFDSELDAASNLLKNGHIRAAGAIAGVVLEGHLKKVCADHGISFLKKGPQTISDYNEALKKDGVIDVPIWRHIQLLGDYRNYCCHPKERDPQETEAKDLIEGARKIVSTVF